MKRNIKNIKNLSLGFGLPKLFDTQESTIQLPKHQKTKTKSEKNGEQIVFRPSPLLAAGSRSASRRRRRHTWA
jgi:hypothetical protein